MVEVRGYPGNLYPPDAAPGHTPSKDSDFVVACKRTAARCGAWPWTPDEWDDSYSNGFAHGKDEATHAGIAGLQRWSGTIDPTGNVGEKTFNFLRSVKVPQGRTHAGEMAMDSVAVNLINAAYEDSQAPPPGTKSAREKALDRAIGQLGVKESPAGSNQCPYTEWYGMVGPWCAMFVTYCYDASGGPGSPTFDRNQSRYSYVPYVVSDSYNGRFGLSQTNSPKPGDLVCYDWQWNGEYDHIGFFEKWTSGHAFTALEGNTAVGNDSNGGEVMRRQRDVNGQATKFIRVAE